MIDPFARGWLLKASHGSISGIASCVEILSGKAYIMAQEASRYENGNRVHIVTGFDGACLGAISATATSSSDDRGADVASLSAYSTVVGASTPGG
jgi:hypothetical protein